MDRHDGMMLDSNPLGDGQDALLQKVQYVCGSCGKKNELAPGAQEIKCKSCSGRIFYKVRQREPIQYEARWNWLKTKSHIIKNCFQEKDKLFLTYF